MPNNDEGWGRVDLPSLIGSSTKNYAFVDQSVLLTNNQQFERRILIGCALNRSKITLTYTDVPGTPSPFPRLSTISISKCLRPTATFITRQPVQRR